VVKEVHVMFLVLLFCFVGYMVELEAEVAKIERREEKLLRKPVMTDHKDICSYVTFISVSFRVYLFSCFAGNM